jgi:hypothetical protein
MWISEQRIFFAFYRGYMSIFKPPNPCAKDCLIVLLLAMTDSTVIASNCSDEAIFTGDHVKCTM